MGTRRDRALRHARAGSDTGRAPPVLSPGVTHRRTSTIAALTVGALALAACGSDGDDGGPAAAGTPAPAATAAVTTGDVDGDDGSVATTGGGQAGSTPASSGPAGTTAAPTAAAVPEALAFTQPLVGGGELDLSTLAGQPVVLWFWAPF